MATKLTKDQIESIRRTRQLTYMSTARVIREITKLFMPEKIKDYPMIDKLIGEKCN